MTVDDEELCKLTQNIWSTVLGLEVDFTDDPHSIQLKEQPSMAGCIHISGPNELAIIVHLTAELARQAASAMLCVEPADASPDDIADAVGELTNMIGGSIKNMCPPGSELSLPSVTVGTRFTIRLPGSHMLTQLAFKCQEKSMLLTMLERDVK